MVSDINDGEKRKINSKLIDYGREMIMLNFLYEQKLLTKNEMMTLKREIMDDYGMKNHFNL